MKFGVNTLLWTAGFDNSHLSLLPPIKNAGFDGVEIARFDFTGFPAAAIRRDAERLGLETIFCSALTGDAASSPMTRVYVPGPYPFSKTAYK